VPQHGGDGGREHAGLEQFTGDPLIYDASFTRTQKQEWQLLITFDY